MEPGPVQRPPAAGTTQVRGRAARAASPGSCSPSRVSSQVHFRAVSSGSRAPLEALLPLWGMGTRAARWGGRLCSPSFGARSGGTPFSSCCVFKLSSLHPRAPGPEGRASP